LGRLLQFASKYGQIVNIHGLYYALLDEGSRGGGHEKDISLNCGDKRRETRRGFTKKKNVLGDVLNFDKSRL